MANRNIVEIDEAKCDGCGQCVRACAEGAIAIRDGKARLVSDVYCDGLGACLGECPQGAIRIIQREADAFDQQAVEHRSAEQRNSSLPVAHAGCPGLAAQTFQLNLLSGSNDEQPSGLGQWPVQLRLVPPNAPFLQDADLLLVADCVPFALADFHQRFLRGRSLVIGCPKLDDAQAYVEKLAAILATSSIHSLTVLHMEVPCCTGLVRIAEAAVGLAGAPVPLNHVTVSIRGKVL